VPELISEPETQQTTLTATSNPEQPTDIDPAAPRYTAADLARARQQEKDKLYPRLEEAEKRAAAIQTQLEELLEERRKAKEAEEAERKRREAEEKKRREEEMSVRDLLLEKEKEWEQRFRQIEEERARERALLEKEREMAQLQSYIQMRINQERDNIAPELIDLVSGNTPEEVEASIEMLKAKTEAILAGVAQAQAANAASSRGVTTAGYAATDGPLDNNLGTKTYSADELKNMPISEWAKIRDKFVGPASSNRGIFG
jgi:Septin family protein